VSPLLRKQFTKNIEKIVRSLYQKKCRINHNMCICEGVRACKELYSLRPDLIEFGIVINEIDVSPFKGVNFYIVEKHFFEKLSATIHAQGIILISKIPEYSFSKQAKSPFALVLDRLSDPGNFGTIFRTCASVGLKDVWYSADSVDPYSEKTIRSAISAQFALNLHRYEDINSLIPKLKQLGYDKVFRTEPAGGKSCFCEEKLFDKSIIIFGNEANGVKEITSSVPINIPMPGKFESLNVAQAVTVILFEAVRRWILE
jgi:TrmH family RNA methyltransferase